MWGGWRSCYLLITVSEPPRQPVFSDTTTHWCGRVYHTVQEPVQVQVRVLQVRVRLTINVHIVQLLTRQSMIADFVPECSIKRRHLASHGEYFTNGPYLYLRHYVKIWRHPQKYWKSLFTRLKSSSKRKKNLTNLTTKTCKVCTILHCRHRRTEPRPQVTRTEKFVKFGRVVFGFWYVRVDRQT